METDIRQTSTDDHGPYLVITDHPAGSTQEQIDRAIEAAHRVFDTAGVDPVEAGFRFGESLRRQMFLARLWASAEEAATNACWAPRIGTPKPTKIGIYAE